MMRFFSLLLISLALSGCITSPQQSREPGAQRPKFWKSSYVAIPLPYPRYEELRKQTEQLEQVTLKHRSEAHITLITPPEMKALRSRLSEQEILETLLQVKLEELPYKDICLGKGSLQQNRNLLKTYFVVIESPDLLQVRRSLQDRFLIAGGDPTAFQAELYFPHITLGFTHRDLHLKDGIKKGVNSCFHTF